jgi:hypothetical protein
LRYWKEDRVADPYPCYGKQYSSADRECQECDVQNSCRNLFISRQSATPAIPAPPPPPTMQAPRSLPSPPPLPPVVPMAPPAQAIQQYRPPSPPVYQTAYPQQQVQVQNPQTEYERQYRDWWLRHGQYQGAPQNPPGALPPVTNWALTVPQPMTPQPLSIDFYRPQSDWRTIFGQFPEEQTVTRLGKNMVLRGGEALALEVVRFLRHWPWPPASGM